MELQERINLLCDGLNTIERAYRHEHYPSLSPDDYYCDWQGRSFLRIVRQGTVQRFVECFVDAGNGNVYKAGGWKAPEPKRIPRFNIASDNGLQRLLAHKWLTNYGYLYTDAIKANDKYLDEIQAKNINSLLLPVGW